MFNRVDRIREFGERDREKKREREGRTGGTIGVRQNNTNSHYETTRVSIKYCVTDNSF